MNKFEILDCIWSKNKKIIVGDLELKRIGDTFAYGGKWNKSYLTWGEAIDKIDLIYNLYEGYKIKLIKDNEEK